MLNPDAFPFPVDVDYGVAAIAYAPNENHDPRGDDTTALMGCGCVDSSEGLAITCGVAALVGTMPVGVKLTMSGCGGAWFMKSVLESFLNH
jgi:hypothetical protein